jgi:hypothetical protein
MHAPQKYSAWIAFRPCQFMLFQSSGSYRDIGEYARRDQASSLCESVCGDRSAFELKADLAQPISSSRTKAWAALRCD